MDRVRLIAEITSPSNAGTDRILKMHRYAEACIPWCLLVEPDPLRLQLYRLDDRKYLLDQDVGPGDMLRLVDPLRVDLDPAELLG